MGGTQWHPFLIKCFDERNRNRIANSPSELLKVHGMHVDAFFFARDGYILRILLNAYERTCLDIIIATILYKILDSLPCVGAFLYLIKDNNGLSILQYDIVYCL